MDSRKVLYFLGLLASNTEGHDKELGELYRRALDDDDRVGGLKMLLESCGFYHEPGRRLLERGRELLKRVYGDPAGALELMQDLINVSDSIDLELKAGAELMSLPVPFAGAANVIRQRDVEGYMEALRMIASVSVWLTALYSGMKDVRELEWNEDWGVQDRIFFINDRFLPAVMRLRRPDKGFIIRKAPLGGRALFAGESFLLSYAGTGQINDLINGLRCEPVCGHTWLNVRAYEDWENDLPMCFGFGNIVSVPPEDGLRLLTEPVAESLRCPEPGETDRRTPSPMPLMKALSGRREFCITGEELRLAMCRWQAGFEAGLRMNKGRCLFCGAPAIPGRLICGGHFGTEL